MARIKNVVLPDNKKVPVGLTYIYGIGIATAKKICKDAGVDENKRIGKLDNTEIAKLRSEVDKYTVEGDLRREVQMNIKYHMEIGDYRGQRHKKKLPVRGQSTRSNARTRRGGKKATVANKKK